EYKKQNQHRLKRIRKQKYQRRREEDTEQRKRQQNLPTEIHQLIETKTRQRPAQPDVQKQKEDYFQQKTDRADQSKQKRVATEDVFRKRHVPATEKQCGRQHRDREHVDVFSEKEERKLHRAVLGMKTGDEFGFSFGKIKRNTIRFGNRRD